MSGTFEFIARAVMIGIVATAVLDIWILFLERAFGIAGPNWGHVGRWIGYFPRGRLFHESIASSPAIPNEIVIGWTAHYVIGIIYALILCVVAGDDWMRAPTLVPALTVGLATMVAPFFLMQPGMGAGVAASKTPAPNIARLKTVANHTVFGLGLFGAALVNSLL